MNIHNPSLSHHDTRSHCLICGRETDGSLVIAGTSVCTDCEKRVVFSSVDEPDYDYLVSRFRVFWEGLAEAAATQE